MDTVSEKVSKSQPRYQADYPEKRSRNRSRRKSREESINRCNTSTVLLSLLVFFVGLVALAGLMVGILVWMETTSDDAPRATTSNGKTTLFVLSH